ncbi:MAG: TolQ protein [Waddliaceae bacterium]|nr:TolQ protein [Waddliaceae bacterium]|tara:strand:- start:2 stop:733 length:732 start_codon:yes stop_codon:yes gene_type:complete
MISSFFLGSNPFFLAFREADIFGKGIFISLFALSLITWVVLLQKYWMTRSMEEMSRDFSQKFFEKQENIFSLNYEPSYSETEYPNPSLVLYESVKKQALALLSKNRSSNQDKTAILTIADIHMLDQNLMTTLGQLSQIIHQHLFVLPTVVSLAPFLGLLGTVWGILMTFSELQSRAGGHGNELVLGGLAMALATTVLGLIVAIPALIAHNYLKCRISSIEMNMENFSQELLSTVELQYRKADV